MHSSTRINLRSVKDRLLKHVLNSYIGKAVLYRMFISNTELSTTS